MIPGISAGSNHVGASETCTPQVSCPSGPDALAMPGAAISSAQASMAQSGAGTQRAPFDLYILVRKKADEHVGARPTFSVGMAFPLPMRRKRRSLQPRSLGPRRALMRNGHFCFLAKAWAEPLPPCPQIIALQSVHKGVANRNLHLAVSRGRTFFSFDGEADPPRPPSHRDDWASAGPVLGECLRRELGYVRRTGRGEVSCGRSCLLVIGRLRPGQRALRSHAHCPAPEYPQARL